MEKVTKTFVSQIKTINEKDFTLEAVVSDETIDRYGEVINIDAWKKRLGNYKSHPVLVSSHSYGKLTNQIGYAEKIYVKDGALVAKFKYFVGEGNPEADWGWKLASKFGQAAYSVGFLPFSYERAEEKDHEEAKMGKKPFLTYTDVELLEVSQVLVPANPSALAKSFDDEEDLVIKEYTESIINGMDKVFNTEDFSELILEDLNTDEVTKGKSEVTSIKMIVDDKKDKEIKEEEMKEVVAEIKMYIDEKFAVIEEFMKSLSVDDEELDEQMQLEREKKELEDRIAKEREEKDAKEKEAEELNYIMKLINDTNKIVKEHIPVQSEKVD